MLLLKGCRREGDKVKRSSSFISPSTQPQGLVLLTISVNQWSSALFPSQVLTLRMKLSNPRLLLCFKIHLGLTPTFPLHPMLMPPLPWFNKIHHTLVFWVVIMKTNVNTKHFYINTFLFIWASQKPSWNFDHHHFYRWWIRAYRR